MRAGARGYIGQRCQHNMQYAIRIAFTDHRCVRITAVYERFSVQA
jgi:hypothetical protein